MFEASLPGRSDHHHLQRFNRLVGWLGLAAAGIPRGPIAGLLWRPRPDRALGAAADGDALNFATSRMVTSAVTTISEAACAGCDRRGVKVGPVSRPEHRTCPSGLVPIPITTPSNRPTVSTNIAAAMFSDGE